MKNLLFILVTLFIFGCSNTDSQLTLDDKNSTEVVANLDEKNINSEKDNWILLSNNPALEKFLINLKKNVETQDMKGIYSQIDPLQMGIQSEDMKMDSCQNVKELFSLRLKEFDSNCKLIHGLSSWKYKGYKKIDTATFDVRGKTKLSNGTIQEFSLLINQLGKNEFVITGAVG